ncbi:hydroxymethylbilane synthase [Telmatospirillum siberiense]|uniref:Porphobilinogen deaminase n=1 Tax=Telmatospirillum siberiense TaxID=382514 RepID=A0A2N3PST0_9PROT|nr:hydroxymethylbilane synthase [Telmatospirillum siberiense]PKU23458.1 hydroxymethylbilane synthase [Telmatospirillum siberiense]
MTETSPLRIGTRGSPLALAQAHEVQARLVAAHPDLARPGAIEIVVIKTTGDMVLDRTLAAIGGKGLFTKEIDEAQLEGRIDIAVHSMKDVPTVLPDGLTLPCILEREDTRDAFLSLKAKRLADLPAGAVVGTASLRRGAQILYRHPHLKVEPLRGNVQTRMKKLEDGVVDATLLAMAGLRRLGLADRISSALETEDMLPAVAQGAIGITCRSGDQAALTRLAPLDHAESHIRVVAERAFLAVLDGSCRTPIGGLAELSGDALTFRGLVIRPDGSEAHEIRLEGGRNEAEAIGRAAGEDLLGRCGPGFFDFKAEA